MIRLDYWNHPLIIKAIRVKYRGGKLFGFATTYLMLLLAGAMALYHYRELMGIRDWAKVYFVTMISVQFVLSAMIAVSATSSSMHSEVTSRTLDFQRIATISPLQILLGKAIGEPAPSYLLAASTLPISVLCYTLGAVSLIDLVLLYIMLATSTLMLACVGLQHSLDPASKSSQGGGMIGAIFFLAFLATSVPIAVVARGGVSELMAAAVGLFTPVLAIKGVAFGPAGIWTATMPFFGVTVPYAVLTPVGQLCVAWLAMAFMTRRLTQPLLTSASKLQSYVVLAVFDLLLAAFVYESLRLGEGLAAPAVRFAIGHTILSLLLMARVTPARESFQSWIWRLRGRQGLLRDLSVGERTVNVLALIVYCLIGTVVFLAAILGPVLVLQHHLLAVTRWPVVIIASVVSLLVLLCYGLCYQALAIAVGRGAAVVFFVGLVVATVTPHAIGAIYDLPPVESLSPIATFIRLQDATLPPFSPIPFVVVHVIGIIFWSCGLAGMGRRMSRIVDRKLESMGITPAIAAD